MEFYQVPISELFPEISQETKAKSISINLLNLADAQHTNSESLRKFTKSIGDRRKDWNGKILTIRANDLQFLSLLLGLNVSATLDYLAEADLLIS